MYHTDVYIWGEDGRSRSWGPGGLLGSRRWHLYDSTLKAVWSGGVDGIDSDGLRPELFVRKHSDCGDDCEFQRRLAGLGLLGR